MASFGARRIGVILEEEREKLPERFWGWALAVVLEVARVALLGTSVVRTEGSVVLEDLAASIKGGPVEKVIHPR